ncbi:hypothetical protein ZIOFF_065615 [Zingiber officinale]|uniref:Uncharacterized protein n=1 Tax=Zingiber officinale TaxID=94328 RepID=A0A8J5EXJ3_ZINOF|nr:hypothetical protein ZIOFF_065615 [Zingiber officinale]
MRGATAREQGEEKVATTCTLGGSGRRRLRRFYILSTLLKWFHKSMNPEKGGKDIDDSVKKGGIRRVKLVVTKKEAAQLLAMFVQNQDTMMFDAITSDIERKETREEGSTSGGWKPVLKSIPEE